MDSISIITPSFRQVSFLRLCSASVADQKGNFHLEHLVQDGGGGEDFEEWTSHQHFADVVSERDEGMYDAINRGFRRARGNILAWLNCDEQYLPGALDKVVRWFEEHPHHHILFGDVILIDPNGEPLSYRRAVIPWRSHIRSCFLPTLSAATFVRRDVIDRGHFLSTRFRAISDAVWIDELLGSGFKAGVLHEPLAVFTQTGSNLGQSEASQTEALMRMKESGAATGIRRLLLSGIHRFRKLLAGAYRIRPVTIEIHVPDSDGRMERTGTVGFRWH